MAIETEGVPVMTDLHEIQARAGDLGPAACETDDPHSGLLSGLERGLGQLRERLFETKAVNDRLTQENVELRSIAEQLLFRLETKPADTLHDQLSALDGQIHGLLELSGGPASTNGAPVAATEAEAAEGTGAGAEGGGPFQDIRERMRVLSDQLLAPIAAPAPESTLESTPEPKPGSSSESAPQPAAASIRVSDLGAPPMPPLGGHTRHEGGSPRVFDRPIKALTAKAQNVLPKVRMRFDAETDYALAILRRLKGARQSFSLDEVRELINGKFGLTLTDRHDAQLSASVAKQDGVTSGPRGARNAPSWRFQMG